MADQVVDNQNPKQASEQAILQKLTSVQQSVDQNSQLTRVLSHPGVRELLNAEAQGRKVMVVDQVVAQKEGEPVDPFKDFDFDKADQKELAHVMLKATSQQAESSSRKLIQQELEKALGPLQGRLQQLDQFAGQTVEQQTVAEIKACDQKYANFTDLRPAMVELNKQYPNMGVERLYKLAAAESGQGVKLKADPTSERGSSSTPLKGIREVHGKEFSKGTKGFDEMLELATGRQDVSVFERGPNPRQR